MGERIGIIAGSGAFVGRILAELRERTMTPVVVGVEGETEPEFEAWASSFRWVKPGQLSQAVLFLKEQNIRAVLMLGKIQPAHLLSRNRFDAAANLVWARAESKSPPGVLQSVIDFFEKNGLEVKNPAPFFKSFFCREGMLTASQPSALLLEDMDFGLRIAKRLANWEVGQVVIVKDRIVVAIEGLEGTDRAILRGGELAGPGIVAVKAGRSKQDMRIDVPGVGLQTVKTLIQAGGAGLAIEANRVAFFEKEEAVRLAQSHGLTIVVRKIKRGGE